MQLATSPLLDRLAPARSILLAGAGGGYDIYAGLPLCFCLEGQGKKIHLANLSFADLRHLTDRPLHPAVVEVGPDTAGSPTYFPEQQLCAWSRARGEERTVHALEKTGVIPLTAAYRALARALDVDAVVLVDGGTDILMRGDEAGLGTPAEDIASLAAADAVDVPIKVICCLGFGVDAFHGVCHAHFLENVAALQRAGAYLGALSLLPQMPEARRYLDAVAWVSARAHSPSIVNASIASAVEGEFGDVHRTARTRGSELFINPLMSQYFSFELAAVAARVQYMDAIRTTRTVFEITAILEDFRRTRRARPRRTIPV